VKGWSVDRAAELLRHAGARNFAVSAAGDMVVSGRAVPELTWSIGIQHPIERLKVAAVVQANELAIATSGGYARGDHVIDPFTDRAPEGVLSVTIVGPELATADAYATAAYAMGRDFGPPWTARLGRYEAMTILANGTVLTTGISRRLVSLPREREGGKKGMDVEVAVIGAGQTGLALGSFLKRQGRNFVILERAADIGAAWRERWDSLTLFTPRRYSALPGLPFPGDPDGYPTRDEVIVYLERHAETFELPIELNSQVKALERGDDGRFRLELDGRTIRADQVVVATGPFQAPYVPKVADKLADDVFQRHAVGYRRPDQVPPGTVLVVGGGNTGFQIAKELSATHEVVLSVGSRQTPLPQRLLGRDLFWWLTKVGILDKTIETRLGRKLSTRDTLIGSSPRELRRRYGVELKPRLVDADGHEVLFEDGRELEVDAVIWATGYRSDYSWIKLPIFAERGPPRHSRGVTDVPGLYFLGLTWQYTRGSALIGWVKEDAEFIAEQIAAYQESKTRVPVGVADERS
jgi:putative flavoprotein involved in K+ transport